MSCSDKGGVPRTIIIMLQIHVHYMIYIYTYACINISQLARVQINHKCKKKKYMCVLSGTDAQSN